MKREEFRFMEATTWWKSVSRRRTSPSLWQELLGTGIKVRPWAIGFLRRKIHQVEMPGDKLAESHFVGVFNKLSQLDAVFCHSDSTL